MIKEVTDQTAWNTFVTQCSPNTFLHSWEWGQVQKALGERVKYLGWFSPASELAGVALVITVNARRGRHYLIPHGPLVGNSAALADVLTEIIVYLKASAQPDHIVALRVAPLVETSPQSQAVFAAHGFRPAPLHLHAELTWVLDIDRSADELLAGMRKTTRQAIAKAQKAGVTTEIITDPAASLQRFWPLYEQTRQRHGFVLWPKKMVQAQLKIFGRSNHVFSVVARYKNQDRAAAILPHFGDTAFYYHGASATSPSSVPATQLLQWAAIQEGKRRGAFHYNFWGVSPADKPNHPFAGLTIFKKGFGGYEIDYLHTQDLPFNLGYWPLWAIDSYRKFRRGFYG